MYIKYIHMYITVHQVQLPERGHRAGALVQQTQYSSVHQYSSTARALGYSGAPDSSRIVHLFHAWNVGLGARPWFEYVPSAANPSDEPSRIDLSGVPFVLSAHPRIVSQPVQVRFPPVARWGDPAGWVREAAAVRAAVGASAGWRQQ